MAREAYCIYTDKCFSPLLIIARLDFSLNKCEALDEGYFPRMCVKCGAPDTGCDLVTEMVSAAKIYTLPQHAAAIFSLD